MKDTAHELQEIVSRYAISLAAIPESDFSLNPNPGKWSRKEVLGHLVDSAQNNLRRFICGQYESQPPHIIYEQDFWVKANGYQNLTGLEVITLWKLLNNQIATVISTMPAANGKRLCDTGRETASLHTIEWLAEDYVKHLKHHLNQIIPGSFNISYP